MPDRLPFILIVLMLGFVAPYVRLRGRLGRSRNLYRLGNREIALIGVASDALSDLWRLLRAKRRSNIVHLPR